MEYFTIGQFAKKANVTPRTVRYYNQIGLLEPSYIGENNYRFYTEEDFIKLQRILILKEFGFSLDEISSILLQSNTKAFQENIDLQIDLINKKIYHLSALRDTLVSASKGLEANKEIDWRQMIRLIELTNVNQKIVEQYKSANNLNIRIDLHNRFSINKEGWFPWLFSQIDFSKVTKLLELGAGNGKLWENHPIDLRNRDIYLSDVSSGMVEELRKNLNNSKDFTCLVIDCEHIPFKDAYFDAIVASHMLFYLHHLDQGLSEIKRVLSKKGTFYCSTYSHRHMQEITELVQEFDSRIELSDEKLYKKFGLENGREILKPYFNKIVMHPYHDYLLVDEAEPIVQYILSCHGNQNEYLNDRYEEFKNFIQDKIEKQGALKITKESGIFICSDEN